ncbi:MAG: hypothetical protein HYX40_05630 [Sphingobacteriales bacterium]|nr:hypothetical protein [Sphingobacteriales bacterium]
MKRLFLLALLAISSFAIHAQDTKAVKKLLEAKDYAKAKDAIDQVLATDKGAKDWEAWFLKGKIYGSLAANEATKSLVPDGRMVAFDAIKKAFEMNNPMATLMLSQEGFKPVFGLYEGYYTEGSGFFNAEKYEDAFNSYKNANTIGEYINKNGWALSALDTSLVFMAGASANNAKKMEDALFYYSKLADAKVSAPDYLAAYKFIIYYYNEKKDDANFHKYLDLGKQIYPKEKYFDEVEIEYLDKKGDKDAVLKKYEDILAKDPSDYENTFYYGATLFNMVYKDDAKIANKEELIGKMEKAFAKCIELKPEEMDAYLELGKSHYNLAVEFKEKADAIKPNPGKALTPDDQAKKKDLQAKAEKKLNDAIPYLEKAFNIMDAIADKKMGQKAKARSIAMLLRDSYNFINKLDKVKFYDAALERLK